MAHHTITFIQDNGKSLFFFAKIFPASHEYGCVQLYTELQIVRKKLFQAK